VTCQVEGRPEPGAHRRAVDVAECDRHPGLAGDAVEARLPTRVAAAGAVGGDDEAEHLARVDPRDDLGDDAARIRTVDGDAAEPAHDRTTPAHEQAAFAEPTELDAE